jgi:fermentation-respiration switch protein FrsA (DUF1100 family)
MIRPRAITAPFALAALCCAGCIELDFFLFEAERADSIAEDYHGLPLYQDDGAPGWVDEQLVEREIYLRVPSAEQLPPDQLGGVKSYVHGAFLRAPQDCPVEECPLIDDDVTFLYQHGNSGHMWRYWYRAVALWDMGANVFIYTYRGYGLSKPQGDQPTRASILADAATAMAYVRGRPDVDQSRVFAYGYSMGGIPTSYLVGKSEHRSAFRATILESALDGPRGIVNLSTGTEWPEGYFLDEDTSFYGPDLIEGADLPVLHMHGDRDSRVLMRQAEIYYKVLKGRPDYTHYLGKTDKPDEEWIHRTGHRNVAIEAFWAPKHISDYWGSKQNPTHCCVHPLEYQNPAHAGFLDAIGGTTGDATWQSSQLYEKLIVDWVEGQLE